MNLTGLRRKGVGFVPDGGNLWHLPVRALKKVAGHLRISYCPPETVQSLIWYQVDYFLLDFFS
jgi:hypothetical protein